MQGATSWMQIAQMYMKLAEDEARACHHVLEEGGDDDGGSCVLNNDVDKLERETEHLVLYVTKIMYLAAGNKFNSAYESHYRTKLQLSILAQVGAGNPLVSTVLYLAYYAESLRLLSAMSSIVRQDALTTYIHHEIMETDEYQNSRIELPESFAQAISKSRVIANGMYFTEASYEYQILMLDYYMQMIFTSQAGFHGNNNNANSFLEEEATADPAQPSKPFFSPLMMMGPQYMSYMTMYLKFFASTMNYQSAQAFYQSAMIDADPHAEPAKHSKEIKTFALQALYQACFMNYQLALLKIWSLYSGAPVAHNAAAANSA
jgi:hypothetical protein